MDLTIRRLLEKWSANQALPIRQWLRDAVCVLDGRVVNLVSAFHLSLAAVALCACSPSPLPPSVVEPPAVQLPAGYRELTPDELAKELTANPARFIILDLRSAEEVLEQGHLPTARAYDFLRGEAMFEDLARLERDRPYLIYCAIGGRSAKTAVKMHELGFKDVTVLKGGLNAWIASGKPVQKR